MRQVRDQCLRGWSCFLFPFLPIPIGFQIHYIAVKRYTYIDFMGCGGCRNVDMYHECGTRQTSLPTRNHILTPDTNSATLYVTASRATRKSSKVSRSSCLSIVLAINILGGFVFRAEQRKQRLTRSILYFRPRDSGKSTSNKKWRE